MNNKVLVTGMSGLIGSALKQAIDTKVIAADYELSALNRRAVDGVPTTQASLEDFDAIRPAFDNQDLVVHLAAVIHDGVGWDSLLNTNVIGTRNVFEAALQAGVKRVIFTSSGATVAGWEKVEPYASLVRGEYEETGSRVPLIDETMATRPANLYASTKVWGESIARHYAENHGLEVICLRIGYANKADRPENARQMSVWNSHRDVVQAIELALARVMQSSYECYFILSENKYAYRDLTLARTVLGYNPSDSADRFND
jgi:nucleoside-diphosphate-sugar epimerase